MASYKSWVFLFLLCIAFLTACMERNHESRILVFSKTSGTHHESIADGVAAIQLLGRENNFLVDTTTDARLFNEDSLHKYSAVVFLSTTGNNLNRQQEIDFERYIQAGGGYVGIHASSDGEYDWRWYGKLAGAYFMDHPGMYDSFPDIQPGLINVTESDHPSTESLPCTWHRIDEWYSFKDVSSNIDVILTLDENSYQGGKKMNTHPIAWCHEFEGGRAFYTGLGHTRESYNEPLFLNHILGGIRYAIGNNEKLNYSNVSTTRMTSVSQH
ncbi:MAG: ThuA domain-containing protein [Rhodocyclaceae bacterium]